MPSWQYSHGSSSSNSKSRSSGTGSSSSISGISSSSNGDVGLNIAVNDYPALLLEVAKPVSVWHRSCTENFVAFNQTGAHLWLYVQSKKKQKQYNTKKGKQTQDSPASPGGATASDAHEMSMLPLHKWQLLSLSRHHAFLTSVSLRMACRWQR